MLDNSSLTPKLLVESTLQSASIFTDTDLRITHHSQNLPKWIKGDETSYIGKDITAVFAQLSELEDLRHALPQPGAAVGYSFRNPDSAKDLVYNLQVEALPEKKYLFSLTKSQATTQIEQLENQNQTLQLLNKASQALIETLDTEVVLKRILQVTNKAIGAEGSSVWLWDDNQSDRLICRAAYYPKHVKSLLGQHIKSGQGVAGWVGRHGKSTVVLNTELDQRFYPGVDSESGFKTKSIIAVPLNMHERTIGVLEVVNKLNSTFTNNDLTVIDTIAATAAVAIENARLVEALQKQMEDLQAQNEELDAFDHSVAHDLQNPLSLIVGFTDVLRQAEFKVIPESDRQHALEMIMTSAQKMSTIIHELLLLSRIRKVEVEKVPLNMEDIVDAALMRVSHMLDSYQVVVHRPETWPIALGHSAWIEEVWENYISNAIKYGGRPPIIELGATLEDDGNSARFWVKDNGEGISPAEQTRLFAPFTRFSNVKVSGQGLGLSIVQRVMNKLGGTVSVDSTVGEGSTFSFVLSVADM